MRNRPIAALRAAPIAAALWALIVLPAGTASAQGGIQPLPPGEKAYGLTLAEWAVAWSQWDASIPNSVHPGNDKTGVRAGIGQRMPVWFLPAGDVPTRTVIVPAGYAILHAGPVGMNANAPGARTEEQLRDELREYGTRSQLKTFEMTVDGVPVPDPMRYRVQTSVFTLVLPPGNWLGVPVSPGKDHRRAAVVDGWFVLFPPLPVGKHVIVTRLEGTDPDGMEFKGEGAVNLTIQNPNDPLP
jgi:hypothetical protein